MPLQREKCAIKAGRGNAKRGGGGERDAIQADIILQPHFVVWERYDRMDPRRQRLGKRRLTNALGLRLRLSTATST